MFHGANGEALLVPVFISDDAALWHHSCYNNNAFMNDITMHPWMMSQCLHEWRHNAFMNDITMPSWMTSQCLHEWCCNAVSPCFTPTTRGTAAYWLKCWTMKWDCFISMCFDLRWQLVCLASSMIGLPNQLVIDYNQFAWNTISAELL